MRLLPVLLILVFYTTMQAQNVGIGTATPQAKLDVNGGFRMEAPVNPSRLILFQANLLGPTPICSCPTASISFNIRHHLKDCFMERGNWNTDTRTGRPVFIQTGKPGTGFFMATSVSVLLHPNISFICTPALPAPVRPLLLIY